MIFDKPNKEILELLNKLVYGHYEAKKSLINLVNRSKIRHHQRWGQQLHKDYWIEPSKVLLVAESGTGKTHLVESLAQILDFPLVKVDATKFVPTGGSGGIKEQDLQKMIRDKAAEYCQNKKGYYHSVEGTIDQTVVFVDEIDKLAQSFESSGNWNQHVQSNFLTLFDNKDEFAGVSFIFAGAFSHIIRESNASSSIGFLNDICSEPENSGKIPDLEDKIIKLGIIPELLGRISSIVELDKFSIVDYYEILVNVILPKKILDLSYFGVMDSGLLEEDLMKIAETASKSGQGIRSLKRQLDKHFLEAEFQYEDYNHYMLVEE